MALEEQRSDQKTAGSYLPFTFANNEIDVSFILFARCFDGMVASDSLRRFQAAFQATPIPLI
jgi:hypothetical protein